MKRICSLKNPQVQAAVRLRQGRHRQKQGRILIDGVRELGRAIQAGLPLQQAFVCPSLCQTAEARLLADRLLARAVDVLEVTPRVFQKLAFGQRAEGLVAVAGRPRTALDELVLPENPLVTVLEGLEKPGNVGAVVRSADAAGLSAIVLADPVTDPYGPNAIRASLGIVFTMPLAITTTETALDWLRQRRLAVCTTRPDASMAYTDADYRRPTAIVLGSEAHGLTPAWSTARGTGIRIPMLGAADSLNVSVAAAVVFYEALRQRSRTG